MTRIVETVSLFVLIAVVCLRPLVPASYDSAGNAMTEALGAISDPSPVSTLLFDLAILLAATGWLVSRALEPVRRYRWTGLEYGAVLVLVAGATSCLVAGNQRLAINATIDWLCLPVLAIALTQLLHRDVYRRILLAAILASATVEAAECYESYFLDFANTVAYYESHKEETWARQGIELDSPKVELFERRMLAREATGSLPHSNVTGSYLVLCGLPAIGVALAGTGALPAAIGAACLGLATLAAVWLTGSLGAMLSGAAAVALWVLVGRFRPWIDAHRRKALLFGWSLMVGGGVAVVAHGLYHGSLPSWSLTFRWQYWQASADLIADHGLTGVGRENFGRHYLAYKAIESPEEISNPHNLFVQAAAEWGWLGLIGVMTMLVGTSRMMLRRRGGPPPDVETHRADGRAAWVPWCVGLVLATTLLRLSLLGTDDADFLYVTGVTTAFVWLVGFAVFAAAQRSSDLPRTVGTGVGVAIFAFLLHDVINFAAFVPGTATTLFAMLALLAADSPVAVPTKLLPPSRHWWPVAGGAVAVAIMLALGLVPVARSASRLALAERAAAFAPKGTLASHPANARFAAAAAADPRDPTPYERQARWLAAASARPDRQQEALQLADEALGRAIARDPHHHKLRRMKAQLLTRLAEATGSAEVYAAAVDAAREALRLYPLDPDGMIALGDCLARLGTTTGDAAPLREAIDQYAKALALDASRPSWVGVRRFSDGKVEQVKSKLAHAREALATLP